MYTQRATLLHLRFVFTVIAVSFLIFVPTAQALHVAHSQQSTPTSSAAWGAVATPVNTPPANQALQLDWIINRGRPHQFFDIVNVGTIALASHTLHMIQVLNQGGNSTPPAVFFNGCLDGTWTAVDSCTGTINPLGSGPTEIFILVNIPLNVGDRFAVQATTTSRGASSYTTTIDIGVASEQVRPKTTTSS